MKPRHAAVALGIVCACKTAGMQDGAPDRGDGSAPASGQAATIDDNAKRLVAQGRAIFRARNGKPVELSLAKSGT